MNQLRKALVLLVTLSVTACTLYREPPRRPRAAGARDLYETQLRRSDIAKTPAYTEWSDAGRRALRDHLAIRPSFKELLYFPENHATAVGYRMNLRRGQRVRIQLDRHTTSRIFTDVFEEIGPGEPIFRLAYSAPENDSHVTFEATTDGPHVLRIQPELARGGEVVVSVITTAALTFPVEGRTSRAIGSRFGEDRDGGVRSHEGIDIFAPSNTRVLAVAAGVITSVANTAIGGNVVWQEDPERNVSYYYAHLNSQSVRTGDRVEPGDEIGKVGNTGNARTTPSHLHFGVYEPGRVAINPEPFLFDQPSDVISPVLIDHAALGDERTVRNDGTGLRSEPNATATIRMLLSRYDSLFVIGGVRDWVRVRLADGRSGFVRGTELGPSLASKAAQ